MWKFSELEYKRPDVDELVKFFTDTTEAVKNAKSGEEVLSLIMKTEETSKELSTMFTIVNIRHTLDTGDEFYDKENQWLNETYPTIMPYMLAYNAAIEESSYRPFIEEKLGKQYFVEMELQKKTFCEENIPLMQAEAKLTDEYQSIMAQCQVEFMGEKRNLYNEKRLEEIWDELIKIRNEMGRNLGYENYIPVGYMNQGRTDYGKEEVASFREQVRRVLVPFCEKLYEAQAKRLGYDKIYAFDEKKVFPDGNAHPIGDDDFMISEAQKMYHELSPETAEFIDFMIDHELLDLKNKPGKASTGYMTLLPSLSAPFVFSCFNGTIFDMQVLTHELGHAFAGYRACRKQPVETYFFSSTDIAEIHSMSMEQFTYGYAERFFGSDADKYRFAHLQEAMTFVPFGVAVDEFQHICYEHPELTPKERTYEWHKLEEKYMPWRTYDNDEFMERGGYWYHKLHIYLYPFYYINYTLTTMGAMEFKKKYAEDPENAWKDYLALTDVGGSKSYLEILKCANLSVPFEEGAVERACGYAMDILEKEMADERI